MGQKINATGLRLKKKLNWSAVFCTHNLQNYSKVTLATNQTNLATSLLLSKINLYSNNILITQDSKKSRVASKLLNKQQIFKKTKAFQQQISARSDNNLLTELLKKRLSLVDGSSFYQFSQMKLEKQKTFNKSAASAQLEKNNFLLLSPRLIAYHICALLKKNARINYGVDSSNLSAAIPLILRKLLIPFNEVITGVKVICSGKWKKTKSGRKQKICIKFGQVRNPSVSNVIAFHYLSQKTKFGSCGVKVWVSHKKA